MLYREIVSFRSCVRTRGLVALWNWISKVVGRPFPFSLLGPGSFPFSLFGPWSFAFSPPPTAQTSRPTLVGLIGILLVLTSSYFSIP